MKNIITIAVSVLFGSCSSDKMEECLPYKAQLFSMGCSAPAVKVLNKDVSSQIYLKDNRFESNVIEVVGLPSNIEAGKTFYFDFRELQSGDGTRPCLAIIAGASRVVTLTKFSYSPCRL